MTKDGDRARSYGRTGTRQFFSCFPFPLFRVPPGKGYARRGGGKFPLVRARTRGMRWRIFLVEGGRGENTPGGWCGVAAVRADAACASVRPLTAVSAAVGDFSGARGREGGICSASGISTSKAGSFQLF